ncbi:MAG TPA: hypothetical protein VF210_00005 [Pseudomonadales bacterium]
MEGDGPIADVPFNGLARGVNDHAAVLYVHGMGDTPSNFDENLIERGPRLGTWSPGIKEVEVLLPRPWVLRGEGLDCASQPDECVKTKFGRLRVRTFRIGDTRSVTLYSYYWHEDAQTIQKNYGLSCERDDDRCDKKEPHKWLMARLNRRLKDLVVVDGFSDATLYAGNVGALMRAGLQAAICMAIRHELSRSSTNENEFNSAVCRSRDLVPDPGDAERIDRISKLDFRLVAKSLGSRMVFDTLLPTDEMDVLQSRLYAADVADAVANGRQPLTRFTAAAVKELLPHTPSEVSQSSDEELKEAYAGIQVKRALTRSLGEVFLLANQLPLLGLSRIEATDFRGITARDSVYCVFVLQDPRCRISPLLALTSGRDLRPADPDFLTFAREVRKEAPKLRIVAFKDVNDLLGFRAHNHFSDGANDAADFVEVRHQNAAVFLWLFALPGSAHANEDARSDSAAMIWCGAIAKSNRNLSARDC